MKNKKDKQKKYLFKSNARKVMRMDELVLYILISVMGLISFAVYAKIIDNYLYYDRVSTISFINLYTHIKVTLILFVVFSIGCYLLYRIYKYSTYPRLNYIFWGLSLILISSIISAITSQYSGNIWWGSYEKANGLLAYLVMYLLLFGISQISVSKKSLNYICIITNLVVIIMCIIGIFQFFGLNISDSKLFEIIVTPRGLKLVLETEKIPFRGTKYFIAVSMLQNPNYFGAFCVTYFPFSLLKAFTSKRWFQKLFYYIGAALTIVGVFIAQAFASVLTLIVLVPIIIVIVRGKTYIQLGVFGAIAGGLVYLINIVTHGLALAETYNLFKNIKESRYFMPLFMCIGIGIIALVLCKIFLKRKISIIIRIFSILFILIVAIGMTYVIRNYVKDNKSAFSQRGYIWHYTQEIIAENPLFGVGPDKYYYAFPQEVEKDKYLTSVVVDKPHNMYLQFITDVGFIGFGGFVILILGLVWKSSNYITSNQDIDRRFYVIGILLVLLAYLVQGIGNDNMIANQVLLYPLLAIAMSITNNGYTQEIVEGMELFRK